MSDLGLNPDIRGDTWGWGGADWTQLQDMGLSARAFHGAAFDSDRGRVVVFGGTNAPIGGPNAALHLFGDTWEHNAPVEAVDDPPPGGLAMTVIPNVVKFGQAITVDFSLAFPQPDTISIVLQAGSAFRSPQIPAMTPGYAVSLVVDQSVHAGPPPFQLDVAAHVDGHVLRQSVSVVP
jgi:hypothetical protein